MISSLRKLTHQLRGHRVTIAQHLWTGILYWSCSCGEAWWK